MLPKKKLAICIPTWNRRQMLQQAIESVLPQLTSDCSLIVLDNASTDDTSDYLPTLGDRVSVIRQPENIGYFGNFNACLRQCEAFEWVAILHSDDLYTEHAVSHILDGIRKNPQAGLMFSKQHQMGANGARFLNANPPEQCVLFRRGDEAVACSQQQIPCSSTVFNSVAILSAGEPSPQFKFCADEEYNSRIATKWDFVELPAVLSVYRRHEGHTMRETWQHQEFISTYMAMRESINDYRTPADRKSLKEVRWQAASTLLGHCSYLDAVGDHHIAERFYKNAISAGRIQFFTNWRLVIRWLIHKTPYFNQMLARRLSKNYASADVHESVVS